MGLVAKSYMRNGFLIYEEMRKYLNIYEEIDTDSIVIGHGHIWLCNRSLLNFLIYGENLIFYQCINYLWMKTKEKIKILKIVFKLSFFLTNVRILRMYLKGSSFPSQIKCSFCMHCWKSMIKREDIGFGK